MTSTFDPPPWQSVPSHLQAKWDAIFLASQEVLNLSAACPICEARTLHRYYLVGREEHIVLEGVAFKARGAGWQWCSTCRRFEHFSGLVPVWWSCDLEVPTGLTALPEALEQALPRS